MVGEGVELRVVASANLLKLHGGWQGRVEDMVQHAVGTWIAVGAVAFQSVESVMRGSSEGIVL